LRYPLHIVTIDPEKHEVIFEDKMLTVSTIPLRHRIACSGYLFKEKEYPRSLIKERVEDIPLEHLPKLKKGEDITLDDGRTILNKDVTKDPLPPRSYAYCSDTAYHEAIIPYIEGASVLYHESTFGSEMIKRAKETFHSTAAQAATIASKAKVGKLYLGHFSARYSDLAPLLREARAIFPESYLSIEGEHFDC
jgi:ribonuclease Z